MKKDYLKKDNEELQEYLHFRKRGYYLANKKGKGSYNRQGKKFRNKNSDDYNDSDDYNNYNNYNDYNDMEE